MGWVGVTPTIVGIQIFQGIMCCPEMKSMYICKKKAMRYASQDFMDNMFGGYSPAKMMVRKKNRMAMEEMEHEAKEAEKCKCEGGGHG